MQHDGTLSPGQIRLPARTAPCSVAKTESGLFCGIRHRCAADSAASLSTRHRPKPVVCRLPHVLVQRNKENAASGIWHTKPGDGFFGDRKSTSMNTTQN